MIAKKLKDMLIQEPIPFAVNGYRRTSTSTANERFFSDLILVWNEGIINAEERASLHTAYR